MGNAIMGDAQHKFFNFKNLFNVGEEVKMKKKFSLPALLAVAIAGFLTLLTLMMASPSFAASSAAKNGPSFGLGGQYIGRFFTYDQNPNQDFVNAPGYPTSNTFLGIGERLRLHASFSYGKADGMPLVSVMTEFDMTNAYSPTGLAAGGYGMNGGMPLGYTPAPAGFNHDFNTFGLRNAYLRLVTPYGMWMLGRMPVKFGLGIAVNTNADGLGDFLPLKQYNLGAFLGMLIGNETSAYASYPTLPAPQFPAGPTGVAPNPYYSHIQYGTIPTLELMTLKPVNHTAYSLWLTEAHLNQFGANPNTEGTQYPTANITFGGLSARYSNRGTKFAGEFDYFRGHIICSNVAISLGMCATQGLPVIPSGYNPATGASDEYDAINSYGLFVTGSKLLHTSPFPITVGGKFALGSPISAGHYDMSYYSMAQNTLFLFGLGDTIGSTTMGMSAPGDAYIYGAGNQLGPSLSNKVMALGYVAEHLSNANTLQENMLYSQWLKTSMTVPGDNYTTQMFAGHRIGTEFNVVLTHHITKGAVLVTWADYVFTGNGVDSYQAVTPAEALATGAAVGSVPSTATHKNFASLGALFIWNF